MRLDSMQEKGRADGVLVDASLAVVSRDNRVLECLAGLSAQEGWRHVHFKNGQKLLKKAPEPDLFAVVWDEKLETPDWQGLAALPPDVTVIVLGDSCPPPSGDFPLSVLNLSPEAPGDAIARAVSANARCHLLARRLAAADEKLAERDGQVKALREHVEFYELQRNQLTEVVRKTAYLGQLSKEINSLDVDKIVNICVTKIPALVDATRASVYFADPDTGELVLKQANHPYRITDRVLAGSSPQSVMSIAMERKATLLIRDVSAFGQGVKKSLDRTYSRKYATQSCIVVPLMSDHQVLAVLNLADKANGMPFDEVRDLPLVDHISQFIGIALRNCQLYQKMWRMAKTDSLTGFVNHNAFFDELHREMTRVQGTGAELSLVLLDVDNFKLFNDVHGHQVGDMILSQVSQIIHKNIRSFDIAARYGGDEFAIILGDTDLERAGLVAERIRRAIAANQLALNDQNFFVTISAGVAQFRKGQSLSDLVNDADAALYRAKSQGRNAVATPTAAAQG